MTFEQALENTWTLFECAREAGIERIVHISVTQAEPNDSLPYYAGKARQEELLKASGVSYAIARPTLVFGRGDILVNNIAWLLRRFPLFPIFGSGDYRIQPVHIGDLAKLCVQMAGSRDDETTDVIGPESYTFEGLVRLMADELRGLMRGKLTSEQEPVGEVRFSRWLREQADELGQNYASELARHFDWSPSG